MFRLDKKVAVITGGASGIGLAIAQNFIQQGAIVHIFEMNMEAAQKEAALLKAKGGEVFCHKVDVSNQTQVKATFETILKTSSVDILVNNAGIAHIGTAETTSEQDFDKLMSVNVKGAYNCIHSIVPSMKKLKTGAIINICSVAASVGIKDRFAYSITKGAILSMTYQVAKDFVGFGIRCNSISPGRVHTPFVDGFLKNSYPGHEEEMFQKLSLTQPLGRMALPSEIGALAVYLASQEASFITGTDFPIDGGFIKLNTP